MNPTLKTNLTFAVSAVLMAACGGAPLPASELATSESAVSAAKEAGADDVPAAAAHLKLANDQIETAKRLIDDGDNEEAKYTLDRAAEDAVLALDLSRADEAREKAIEAQKRIRNLKAELDAPLSSR